MELGLGLGLRRRHLMASVPVFSPLNISGLKLWIDASDISTLTVDGSNRMSAAADKSGNGYGANQTDTTQMPLSGTRNINGLNVFDFDGSNDCLIVQPVLSMTGAGNTIFAVGAVDTNAVGQAFLQGMNSSNSTRQFLGYGSSGTSVTGQNGSASAASTTVTPDLNAHILVQSVFSQLDVYYDGVSVASGSIAGTSSITNLGIGRRGNSVSNPLNGRIAEILIYDRALSGAEKNQVGQYLATKWNVSWTDHSYSTLVVMGDSITAGQNASTTANRWPNIAATALGAHLINQGISGTYLQNTVISTASPGVNNGRDRYALDICGRNRAEYVVILYGVNDTRDMPVEPNLSLANFTNDYQEIITGLLADGYPREKIIIGSPSYYTGHRAGDTGGAARLVSFASAVRDLAVTNQVKFADVYNYMVNNGAASLLSGDNLHPNDSGHAAIATAILAADFVS